MRPIHDIATDEDGSILPFVGVSLAVLLGMVALSFDLGRQNLTRIELQSYADSVALAAAGELDGRSDAITRATAAAANLISDTQSFGSGARTLQGAGEYALTFLTALPAGDYVAPYDLTGLTTTNPGKAAFVHVDVVDRTVQSPFGSALVALSGQGTHMQGTADAVAIAGFTQFACDVTPLMFCVPRADPTDPTSPLMSAAASKGKMIQMRTGRQNAAWGPGDFGFLDPTAYADDTGPCAGLSGNNYYSCLIAGVNTTTKCFSQNGVDTQPGQGNGRNESIFNVRFDIYRSTMNGQKNNPLYAPAPNVVKGVIPPTGGGGNGGNGGNQCLGNNVAINYDDVDGDGEVDPGEERTMGLPADTCFGGGATPNTCGSNPYGARVGDGNWESTRYVNTNHNGSWPTGTSATSTRYEMYLAEIRDYNDRVAAANGAGTSTSNIGMLPRFEANGTTSQRETGLPRCSGAAPASPSRRVLILAGIDCESNPINGAEVGVPVHEFYEVFLTEPVRQTDTTSSQPSFDMMAEVIGSAGGFGAGAAKDAGIFHDVVQLYR